MKPALIHVRPVDTKTDLRVDIYLGTASRGAFLGIGGLSWETAVVRRPRISVDLMSPDLDGTIQTMKGDFAINLKKIKQHPDSTRLNWVGAPVIIYDASGMSLDKVEFTGIVRQPSPDLDSGQVVLNLEVSTERLDKPVLYLEYTGAGGLNGYAELKGTPKPAGFGFCENIPVTWIDKIRNIAQIDGYANLQSVQWLGEGLSSFGASVGNYSSYALLSAAIDAGAVPRGRWATCIADGLVGLGAPPAGKITVDATFGSNRTGALIRRLVEFHAGIATADIAVADFAALDVAVDREVRAYLSEQRTVIELTQALAGAANAGLLILPNGKISVTRAFGGASAGTINRNASAAPRVTDWKTAEPRAPIWRIKARTARPGTVMSDDEINYEDDLIDRGAYSVTETYRIGHYVWAPDGSQWLYTNATPAAGQALPVWPTTSNAYWFNRRPPTTAADLRYADGTLVEALKPGEAGATNDANLDDGNVLTINEKRTKRLDKEANREAWSAQAFSRATALGIGSVLTSAMSAQANWLAYRDGISGWNNVSIHTAITRSTWVSYDSAYDAALAALDKAISEEDAKRADWSRTNGRPPLLTGESVTVDEYLRDPSVWAIGSGSFVNSVTDGEGWFAAVPSVAAAASINNWFANSTPIDKNATYNVSIDAIEEGSGAGLATFYLGVQLYDAAGNNINGDGYFWHYFLVGTALPSKGHWHTLSARIGKGTNSPFPANAARFSLAAFPNYNGASSQCYLRRFKSRRIIDQSFTSSGPNAWTLGDGVAIKNTPYAGAWGNVAYSKAAIKGPQRLSWRWAGGDAAKMVGLGEGTPATYQDCDYNVYADDTPGSIQVYYGGGPSTAYTGITDRNQAEFAIEYDGLYLRGYKNGVPLGNARFVGPDKSYRAVVDCYFGGLTAGGGNGVSDLKHQSTLSLSLIGNNTFDSKGIAWIAANGATSDISLTSIGAYSVGISGNTVSASTTTGVDNAVRGELLTGACVCEMDIPTVGYAMAALDVSPTVIGYLSQNIYVDYFAASGACFVSRSGSAVHNTNIGAGITGKLRILYDKTKYRVFVGNVEVGAGSALMDALPSINHYPKFYAYTAGSVVTGCRASSESASNWWDDVNGIRRPEDFSTSADNMVKNGSLKTSLQSYLLATGATTWAAGSTGMPSTGYAVAPIGVSEALPNNNEKLALLGAKRLYVDIDTIAGSGASGSMLVYVYFYKADGSAASVPYLSVTVTPSSGSFVHKSGTVEVPSDASSWSANVYTSASGNVMGWTNLRIAKTEAAADVTSAINGSGSVDIPCDSGGTPAPALSTTPKNVFYTLIRNGVDVTTAATWTATVLTGSATVSFPSGGQLRITAIGAATSRVRLTAVYAGTSRNFEMDIIKQIAAAPTGGGGGGGTSATTTLGFASSSTTMFTASTELVFNTGSSGIATLSGSLSIFPTVDDTPQGTFTSYWIWQRWNGSAWVDVGTETISAPHLIVGRFYDPDLPGFVYTTTQEGEMNLAKTVTGLTANAEVKFRLNIRCGQTTKEMYFYTPSTIGGIGS